MDRPDQRGSLTMQIRTMRARGTAAIGLLTALAASGACAQTPNTPHLEASLLGIRLLANYNDVLHKFGQPNEIQIGDPTVSGQGVAAAPNGASGGLPGMGGPPMGMMGRGMGGAPMGMSGAPMSSSMPMGMRPGMPGGIPGMGGGAPMS